MRYSATQYAQVLYQTVADAPQSQTADQVRKFVQILKQHGRQSLMPDIMRAFAKLADERSGTRRVEVESAGELDLGHLQQQLGHAVKVVHQIRPELLGGVRIRLGDSLIDNSLVGRIAGLRQQVTS